MPEGLTHETRKATFIRLHRELLERMGISPKDFAKARYLAFGTGDLADFEPYLRGEKTLAELRDAGVDTSVVWRATLHTTKMGTVVRDIQLYSAVNAVERLTQLLGLVTTKQEIEHTGGLALDLSKLSMDELRGLAHAVGDDTEPTTPKAQTPETSPVNAGGDEPQRAGFRPSGDTARASEDPPKDEAIF